MAPQVDHSRLANAVHGMVTQITGDDGYRGCMTYAVGACIWLRHRFGDDSFRMDGGHFVFKIGRNEVLFEHFWCTNGLVIFDYATRHNVRLVRDGLKKAGLPDWIPHKAIRETDLPYYVGPGDSQSWVYAAHPELAKIAHAEYVESLKVRGLILSTIDKGYE